MKKFVIKNYELKSDKLREKDRACFAVLADLHGFRYGKENRELIQAIKSREPDAVLVVGDMLVRSEPQSLDIAAKLLQSLSARYPVYYALGNHESQMLLGENRAFYQEYETALKKAGVRFLHNEKVYLEVGQTLFCIHGLELPLVYYHKPRSPRLKVQVLNELLGTPGEEVYHILLAHNPKYGNAYFSWGADLTLSGHYHGGVVRFSKHRGLTSPQYLFLPPFCCGDFHKDGRHMLVSAGLGEHTIPVRIHNPRELIFAEIRNA